MVNAALVGIMKAHGTLGKYTQRALLRHCVARNYEEVLKALSVALLSEGLVSNRVPANAGIRTSWLVDTAVDSIRALVQDYKERGGVVLAKGHLKPEQLEQSILKLWNDSFSSEIPQTVRIDAVEEELRQRLCVVALSTKNSILRCAEADGDEIRIPLKSLEGLCSTLAHNMYQAFTHPNETNHELIHGKRP